MDLFLGDLGAISLVDAQKVFPLLSMSMENPLENEQDWLLEALYKLFHNLDQSGQAEALKFAERWQFSSRKTTQKRARRLLALKH